ncbi:hypothetical protein HELRODRAFT_83366 [Helobdella robusta]|uniref:GBD/FH3 domain-containing protein n=1 Tax=Helobdella robusta TaxID=6412 RepID=T1G547_HELRO|nr:hypothetical protein HELRODRAFT_83366 [Helobdella robusta]ESO00317.1 hypothetical protein HELRODRAFT_83366 [Helobdella robusta]
MKLISQVDFENCDPKTCLSMLKMPSLKMYVALNKKLKSCRQSVWMKEFLELGGLAILLEGVNTITGKKVQLSDALVLIEYVACIKTVMNSSIGLRVITNNKEYSQKLIKALDSNNTTVKKQIFDLLSGLRLSSEKGFECCIEAVNSYKTISSNQYLFNFMMNELKNHSVSDYSCSIMSFINCIIHGVDDLAERMKIKKEFIGLNLLDMICGSSITRTSRYSSTSSLMK